MVSRGDRDRTRHIIRNIYCGKENSDNLRYFCIRHGICGGLVLDYGGAPGSFQREIIIDWPDSHRSNENKMVKVDKNTAFSEAITYGNSSRENNKRTGFLLLIPL